MTKREMLDWMKESVAQALDRIYEEEQANLAGWVTVVKTTKE